MCNQNQDSDIIFSSRCKSPASSLWMFATLRVTSSHYIQSSTPCLQIVFRSLHVEACCRVISCQVDVYGFSRSLFWPSRYSRPSRLSSDNFPDIESRIQRNPSHTGRYNRGYVRMYLLMYPVSTSNIQCCTSFPKYYEIPFKNRELEIDYLERQYKMEIWVCTVFFSVPSTRTKIVSQPLFPHSPEPLI